MSYIPHSDKEKQEILNELGISDSSKIFGAIPSALRLQEYDLPSALEQMDLEENFAQMGARNEDLASFRSFLGAGSYDHYVPAVVDELSSRGEFLTPYTPYQAEVSQGTLQTLFEFQSMISSLTGMDLANASMYDGASAVAEAVLMASRTSKKNVVLVSYWLHPEYWQVLRTYTAAMDLELCAIGNGQGLQIDQEELIELLREYEDRVAAVVLPSPNFAGVMEDVEYIAQMAHEHGAFLIATLTEALSLAYVRGPGEFGADIFAGEGQSFGLYPQAGGPFLGLFSVKKDFMRSIPGRIVGQTQELWPKPEQDKQDGYVLTLATREQHIRRERATSNICTNQGVLAVRAAIYLALNGGRGLYNLAERNHTMACRLRRLLDQSTPWQVVQGELPVFNEFLIKTPYPAEEVVKQGQFYGILPGVPLSLFYPERTHELVVSVTERIREEDIQAYLDFATHAAPVEQGR